MDSNDVKDAAREVGDHRAVETLARVGYGASGLLHLVMGYIALKVAWSGSGEKADQSGALALLAGNTAGRLLLWVLVVGFWGLALWQLTEAIVGRGETSDRAKAFSDGYLYSIIRYGRGVMPKYGDKVHVIEKRWEIVNYVRMLQAGGSLTPAAPAATPAAEPAAAPGGKN